MAVVHASVIDTCMRYLANRAPTDIPGPFRAFFFRIVAVANLRRTRQTF